jgi:hypothetical protein
MPAFTKAWLLSVVRFGTAGNSSMAEGESATCADIIDDFCNSSIFTTKFTTN